MILPTILAVAVIAGALLYVARPFFRVREPPGTRSDAAATRRLALVEERDRALAALQELEFDHRTGKISDGDYRDADRTPSPACGRDTALARAG